MTCHAEHGMEITFDPRPGMYGGAFEIERTRSREPGERPRSNSAISIEAGFVTTGEPEPDYVEDVEEEEFVDAGAPDDAEDDGEERRPEAERPGGERSTGERDGGRKRRRRGGRGRNRDRAERPEGAAPQPHQVAEPAEGAEIAAAPDAGVLQNGQPALGDTGETGEARRKRRRRRGRRGGRDRGESPEPEGMEHHQTGFAAEADRFGPVPDEIDTTPRNSGPGAPGAPSAPVWSLKDDELDTTPKADKPKQGWWQKAFGGE
jgi:ribonuclease E